MDQLIKVDALSLSYGATKVLHDVSFRIGRGEIVTIVGPNGSGKSSLLKCLIGAVPPSAGRIVTPAGLTIGYTPQKLANLTTLPITVQRFLQISAGGRKYSESAARVGCDHLMATQLTDLSGGQLQRMLLARAIQSQPDILILDEATQGLDQRGSAQFYSTIADIRDETQCAVLMVSHELHVVMAASDRVICLNGHVCCHGTPQVVQQADEYRALFGTGTGGALALYPHNHDHDHSDTCGGHSHD